MTDTPEPRLRMDLFLKRSRLVKRRPLAATLCDNGYVKLNGRETAPGKTVKVGDRIEVQYARRKVLVEEPRYRGKGPVRRMSITRC